MNMLQAYTPLKEWSILLLFISLILAPLFPIDLMGPLRLEHGLTVLFAAIALPTIIRGLPRKNAFYFGLFILVVLLTNLYWAYHFSEYGFLEDVETYVFGAICFFPALGFVKQENERLSKIVPLTIFSGLAVLLLVSYDPERLGRTRGFFSNYNQLSRVILFSSTIGISFLESKRVWSRASKFDAFILLGILFVGGILIVLSGSRSAIIGFASLFLIAGLLHKKLVASFLLTLVIAMSIMYASTSNYATSRIDKVVERFTQKREFDDSLSARGYDRFFQFPSAILWGKGEHRQKRFNESGLEFHSTYGSILFSYGVFGLVSFLFATINFKPLRLVPFLLLIPLQINSLFHNDARNIYFWIILAIIYVATSTPIHQKTNLVEHQII